jgi:hypothetical protein
MSEACSDPVGGFHGIANSRDRQTIPCAPFCNNGTFYARGSFLHHDDPGNRYTLHTTAGVGERHHSLGTTVLWGNDAGGEALDNLSTLAVPDNCECCGLFRMRGTHGSVA